MIMDRNKQTPELPQSIWVGTEEYPIDPDTALQLENGEIPDSLKSRITATQGREFCFEFCRQRRLMHRVLEQIEEGKQPVHLRPIIKSGTVPPEILYKLCHRKLIGKAEKLYKSHLITKEVLDIVQDRLLTPEILPALSHAFLVDTAIYLYNHNEITAEILQGVKDGSVDPVYIRIIRRHYRYMTHLEEQQDRHSFQSLDEEKSSITDPVERLMDTSQSYDFDMNRYFSRKLVMEAAEWLTTEEKNLLCLLYYDHEPMTSIATRYGVTEGTIRYRRDRLLKRLRFILQNVMGVQPEDIF